MHLQQSPVHSMLVQRRLSVVVELLEVQVLEDAIANFPLSCVAVVLVTSGFPTTYAVDRALTWSPYQKYACAGRPTAPGAPLPHLRKLHCKSPTTFSLPRPDRGRRSSRRRQRLRLRALPPQLLQAQDQ